jgi:hypothetical protein
MISLLKPAIHDRDQWMLSIWMANKKKDPFTITPNLMQSNVEGRIDK